MSYAEKIEALVAERDALRLLGEILQSRLERETQLRKAAEEDAARFRWVTRHASLGFDSAPSWNAVVRLPVFDSDDQTITALVDRAMAVGAA